MLPNEHLLQHRCLSNFDQNDFANDLRLMLSSPELIFVGQCSLNGTINLFLTAVSNGLTSTFDSHASLRNFLPSKPKAPWLILELRSRIRLKNTFYKQAKRTNSLLGFAIYRDFRNKLTSDLRTAKDRYQLDRLSAIHDPNRMWRELTNLGLIKPRSFSPLNFFSSDQLNSYYISISSSCGPLSLDDLSNSLSQIIHQSLTLSFSPISLNEKLPRSHFHLFLLPLVFLTWH